MNYNNILFLIPAITARGGIVSYFKSLEGRFELPVVYFTRGARHWPIKGSKFQEFRRVVRDISAYWQTIGSGQFELVQTSTSLGRLSLIRDGIFLILAQVRGIKTIAFFRGWDENVEKRLTGLKLKLFKRVFFRTSAIIVLSEKFKLKIQDWGYTGSIFVETTVVDENLISGFDQYDLIRKIHKIELGKFRFLFLSRTERKKGLYETIDAFKIINEQYPDTSLSIVGDGFELQNAKDYVNDLGISNIAFKGFLTGPEKANAYTESDMYIFPSYTEGMPNSVLEAMAFGLPVITTPVGGLTDFFKNGEHGYLIQNNKSSEIAKLCTDLMLNKKKYSTISKCNFDYARKRFTSSKVIQRLEEIYKTLIY